MILVSGHLISSACLVLKIQLIFQWLSSLAGMEESQAISTSTGHLLLLAGRAGSLDGAILGYKHDKRLEGGNMLAVLSHLLVLSSSREKDNR